jgi:hypothetical protein
MKAVTPAFIERRQAKRYDLRLPLIYKAGLITESGTTLNISTAGLLFRAGQDLRSCSVIELRIAWPVLLDGVIDLQLCVRGRVVRESGDLIAVKFVGRPTLKTAMRAQAVGEGKR